MMSLLICARRLVLDHFRRKKLANLLIIFRLFFLLDPLPLELLPLHFVVCVHTRPTHRILLPRRAHQRHACISTGSITC